jgi:hypothetical protein
MAKIEFPSNPTPNQEFTSAGITWKWNAVNSVWAIVPNEITINNEVKTIYINEGDLSGNGTTEEQICEYINNNITIEYTKQYSKLNIILEPEPSLKLVFDNISNADLLVGNSNSVEDWNTFFDLPTYGNPFTSVEVVGNEVRLFGGSGITIKYGLMQTSYYLYDDPYNPVEVLTPNTSLISINDLANCVIEIENDSFHYCVNLESINFPVCLNTTEDGAQNYGAFTSCTSLTSINMPLLENAGYATFGDTGITTINLPNLITAGDSCFYNCSSLTTIDLPSLTTAGYGCFYDCTSLITIDLLLLESADGECFGNCTSLTTVDLPSLTTAAGYGCFTNCTSLTTVDLPLLTTAGQRCFKSCTSLTTINLPSCTDLGGTVGDDFVFDQINGNTITATFNSVLTTNNGGNPDGDIQQLLANNTVTITYV